MDDMNRSSGSGEDSRSGQEGYSGSTGSGESTGAGQSGYTGGTGRWGSWMQDYESGNYDNLPHDDIISSYRDWSATAQPDHVHEATSYGYQSLPQEHWSSAAEGLSSYCQRRGLNLSDLGVSSDNHQEWGTEDLARVTSHTYRGSQEDEEEEGGGIPKPLVGLALAGALAYAARRFMGSGEEENQESYRSDTEDQGSAESSTYYSGSTSEQSSSAGYGTGSTSGWEQGAGGSTSSWDEGTTGSTGSWETGSSGSGSMSGSSGSSSEMGSGGSGSRGSTSGASSNRETL